MPTKRLPRRTVFTPEQCRAARHMLRIKRRDLCALAGVCDHTLEYFERGYKKSFDSSVAALKGALERSGVVFLGNWGVALKALYDTRTMSSGPGPPGMEPAGASGASRVLPSTSGTPGDVSSRYRGSDPGFAGRLRAGSR